MIVGLGLDLASVERIQRVARRFPVRFAERLLAEDERSVLTGLAEPARTRTLAGRFAAKEAAVKALGGPADIGWHDLVVRRGASGAPALELRGRAAAHASRLGVTDAHVSITHDAGVAAAVVVLERAQ